ncbi:MAG: hypothetical protein CUN54_08570 [Phototrophicales bacterium]|nr:MAG: hypothetical protein CUN54_08570 [Phototrophicales bacterium]
MPLEGKAVGQRLTRLLNTARNRDVSTILHYANKFAKRFFELYVEGYFDLVGKKRIERWA